VKLWEVTGGGERTEIHVTPRQGLHAAVMSLTFGPDHSLLAMACDDLTIRLHDVASGKERITIPQSCFANTVAFAPDGRTVAWAGTNPGPLQDAKARDWMVITLWDVAAQKVQAVLAGHRDGISSVAFSADGKNIVSGSYDQTVRLWQVATGRELATLQTPQVIHGVAISPDGRTIAAATGNRFASDDDRTPSRPGNVILWEVATRKERATLSAHESSARAVVFSPDGKILASGGYDGSIKLWEPEKAKERATLRGHQGYVYSLAFAPDGRTVASAGVDSTVRVWDLAELLALHADDQ
jgi:WD40 repeat protein